MSDTPPVPAEAPSTVALSLVCVHTDDGRVLVPQEHEARAVQEAAVAFRAVIWWSVDSCGAVQPVFMPAERYGVGMARAS